MPSPNGPRIAVVGAGFSGLLTAIHLLRLDPAVRVALIERRRVFGPGVAYDTGNPEHLLNVRLDRMSAFPDRPDHLADWLAEQPAWRAQDGFITRGVYGDYLKALLDQALDGAPGRLDLIQGEVDAARSVDAGWRLTTDDGREIAADALVLALGNLEPASPPGAPVGARHGRRVAAGLTMIDVALSLRRPGRRMVALSRHGLLPRAHMLATPAPSDVVFAGGPAAVLRQVRQASRDQDWRGVIDHLRLSARDLWRGWTEAERRRFLRHVRPLWDVHRHRLSPGVAREAASMLASGDLTVLAGKLAETLPGDPIEVAWRPRGRRRAIRERFDLVVNCTGPLGAIGQSREPLIVDLLAAGHILPDPLGLGVLTDDTGRLGHASGAATPPLYGIGPLTRGAFWEITAVPDLRIQAQDLARRILAA